ncbi:hypothetical protein D3C80_797330 [compost metagenome]
MVLQVAPYTRQFMDHLDTVLLQYLARADAGKLQQLRRLQCASAEQYFLARPGGDWLAGPLIGHPDRALTTHQHLAGLGVSLNDQVLAGPIRLQIGLGRRATPAVASCQLKVTCALLAGAIEIGIARNADFLGTTDEGIDQLVGLAQIRDMQGATAAVIGAFAALVAFHLLEIGQHVTPAPALVALLFPGIVVLGLAADIDQSIDRAATAEGLAAGPVDRPAVQLRHRLGVERPVVGRVEHGLAIADRQVDPEMPIIGPGLQQQHAVLLVLAETGSERATGGARAHYDVVVLRLVHRSISYLAAVASMASARLALTQHGCHGRHSCVQEWAVLQLKSTATPGGGE